MCRTKVNFNSLVICPPVSCWCDLSSGLALNSPTSLSACRYIQVYSRSHLFGSMLATGWRGLSARKTRWCIYTVEVGALGVIASLASRQGICELPSERNQGGFRIGFKESSSVSSARRNMHSALENSEVVSAYLAEEKRRGVLLGPFERSGVPEVHLNRFGVIPKSSQPVKGRLIVDLSDPEGRSVNDSIQPEVCTLQYVRVEDVVQELVRLRPGAKMAKLDIRSAYRMVPVHPQDRHLLGMMWEERVYVDAALPFGLRSAPKIFTALADAIEWIAKSQGVQHLWHYLDDFIICGEPDSEQCHLDLESLIAICNHLGVPLALEKVEGPTVCLVFLGILIDTNAGELMLPREKSNRLCHLIREWLQKKWCQNENSCQLQVNCSM